MEGAALAQCLAGWSPVIEKVPWTARIRQILAHRERAAISREWLRPSAVLVPVYEKSGEYFIVLTKRSEDLEHHKGQISFPGGAYEEGDGDLETTALREAYEEIGVRPEDVEVLGKLDDQATLSSYFNITPFVGAIPNSCTFTVNTREVVDLIEAPVAELLRPGAFEPETRDPDGDIHPWGQYHYGRHQITGITARILKQLLDLAFAGPG